MSEEAGETAGQNHKEDLGYRVKGLSFNDGRRPSKAFQHGSDMTRFADLSGCCVENRSEKGAS